MRSCPRLVCSLPFCIIDALCSTLHAVAAAVALNRAFKELKSGEATSGRSFPGDIERLKAKFGSDEEEESGVIPDEFSQLSKVYTLMAAVSFKFWDKAKIGKSADVDSLLDKFMSEEQVCCVNLSPLNHRHT